MTIIKKLQHHSGANVDTTVNPLSLPIALWQKQSIDAQVEDILDALQNLNIEANGPVPSESFEGWSCFTRTLVAAIQEIIRMLREPCDDAQRCEQMQAAASRIERAWSAILAGDIDDVKVQEDGSI